MPDWVKHKLESRLLGEMSVTSDMQMTSFLWQKAKTKEPPDESKSGQWKSWLKTHIQKTNMMASGPITSWQIDGETVKTMREFVFGSSKITTDGDCSHKVKRHLLLGRKAMTNLYSILKSRNITLPTKACLVKAMIFSSSHVWMWELDYRKTLSTWRIHAFELWCWRRLLRVPWAARRSSQSILKESSPEYSLEGVML